MQTAKGEVVTFVSGEAVQKDGHETGARPARRAGRRAATGLVKRGYEVSTKRHSITECRLRWGPDGETDGFSPCRGASWLDRSKTVPHRSSSKRDRRCRSHHKPRFRDRRRA